MIEYIEIENFQSHTDTRIDLSEGITAITGLSMNGKTAIKRAFEWLRKNRPLGFRFNHRYGNGPTKVEVGVDGHIVSYLKSNSPIDSEGNKSAYKIKYPDGKEDYFTVFGSNVPEEVSSLLGISDISIQDQLDAYLLVISSSGEIAKTINKITGIDIGDKWVKEIRDLLKDIKRESSKLEGEIVFIQRDIQKYEGVDDLYREIQAGMILESEYKMDIEKNNSIVDYINSYRSAEQWRRTTFDELSPLESLLNEYEYVVKEISSIEEKTSDINSAMLTGEAANEVQSALDLLLPDLAKLEEINSIKEKMTGLKEDIRLHKSKVDLFGLAKEQFEEGRRKLEEALRAKGICGLCGGPLTDDRIRDMMENL